jgi:XTP/dITP diphosphohydrolase
MKICFATNNVGKKREVESILSSKFELQSLKDIGCMDILPETHFTFEENAIEKAMYVYKNYKIDCFADDSGLEVDALDGAPGVFSARYAGLHSNDQANNELLLKNMEGISNRSARYKVVIALVLKGETTLYKGTVEGKLISFPKGRGGFGYDSLFIPDGFNETFAELPLEIKNTISHRGKAMKLLVEYLNKVHE